MGCFRSLSVVKTFSALSNSPHFEEAINSYCNLAGEGVLLAVMLLAASVLGFV